jgi:2-beta-glucuronyltransferase
MLITSFPMKQAILITQHYLESKRMAGFHWLARALHRAGWDVLFFTGAISQLSWLRRDYRFAYPVRREANRLKVVEPRLQSYVWFTPWHPANLRSHVLNRLSYNQFAAYGQLPLGPAEPLIRDAKLIIFESTPAVLLFDRFKQLAPAARFVYRVSDDLRVLKNHPVVIDTEDRIAPAFDLISVPSNYIYERYRHLPHTSLHQHGIARELFDASMANPYNGKWERNVVFVGTARFDSNTVTTAAARFPQWGFHLIGPLADVPKAGNVIAYGERPFAETVAYLKHADIGFYPMSQIAGGEVFQDSLKVIQYTYCRLPVVAPDFLGSPRQHVISYKPGNADSIQKALLAAGSFERSRISTDDIRTWDELAGLIAGE